MNGNLVLGVGNIVIALVLAGLTYWYAKSTKELVELSRPVPSVMIDIEFERGWLIYLVIRNVGNAVASNIRVHVLTEVVDIRGNRLDSVGIFNKGIPSLAPGREIRALYGVASELYKNPSIPKEWDFDIVFCDLSGKEMPHQPYRIDMSIYADLGFVTERTLNDVHSQLKAIDRTLGKMVSTFPRGVRIVTTEDVRRERDRLGDEDDGEASQAPSTDLEAPPRDNSDGQIDVTQVG